MGHHHEDDDEFEDDHDHPRGFLSGVLLGGFVGVAVGLLLAPAAGQVTRQKLRDRAVSARDQALEAAEGARHQALQAAEEVRAKAEDIQNTGREMLEENKRRIVRTAEAVRQLEHHRAVARVDIPVRARAAAGRRVNRHRAVARTRPN